MEIIGLDRVTFSQEPVETKCSCERRYCSVVGCEQLVCDCTQDEHWRTCNGEGVA